MANPDPKRPYHHGSLRAALIEAAIEAVASGGSETFSLRDAARQAGVTPGAVYKHFASKSELLGAAASAGFQQLAAQITDAMQGLDETGRLEAVGLAYVAFAAREPHLFSLMFGPSGQGAPRDGIASPPGGAFDTLRNGIATLRGISPSDVDESALALAWAAAHGAARLVTDGLWRKDDPRISMAIKAAVAALR
jgi:AcrR family transcriptional regulator